MPINRQQDSTEKQIRKDSSYSTKEVLEEKSSNPVQDILGGSNRNIVDEVLGGVNRNIVDEVLGGVNRNIVDDVLGGVNRNIVDDVLGGSNRNLVDEIFGNSNPHLAYNVSPKRNIHSNGKDNIKTTAQSEPIYTEFVEEDRDIKETEPIKEMELATADDKATLNNACVNLAKKFSIRFSEVISKAKEMANKIKAMTKNRNSQIKENFERN